MGATVTARQLGCCTRRHTDKAATVPSRTDAIAPIASRHACVLTLRQSRHSPDREGASRRLLTTPSSPRCSATHSSARPSSNCSDSETAGQPERSSRPCRHAGRFMWAQGLSVQHPSWWCAPRVPPCCTGMSAHWLNAAQQLFEVRHLIGADASAP